MREAGSMTYVLIKIGAEWKIQSWAWTSPDAKAIR